MGGGGRSIQNTDPRIYEVNWDCPKNFVPFKTQYGQNIIALKVYPPSVTDTMLFFLLLEWFFYSKMAMTENQEAILNSYNAMHCLKLGENNKIDVPANVYNTTWKKEYLKKP